VADEGLQSFWKLEVLSIIIEVNSRSLASLFLFYANWLRKKLLHLRNIYRYVSKILRFFVRYFFSHTVQDARQHDSYFPWKSFGAVARSDEIFDKLGIELYRLNSSPVI